MHQWKSQLLITETYLRQYENWILEQQHHAVGFYSFVFRENGEVLPDNMFVLPDFMGQGYGAKLMQHFFQQLRSWPVKKIVLEADPNAEGFYLNYGFTVCDRRAAGDGRYLPVMEKVL